jgi:hypothetical protein
MQARSYTPISVNASMTTPFTVAAAPRPLKHKNQSVMSLAMDKNYPSLADPYVVEHSDNMKGEIE